MVCRADACFRAIFHPLLGTFHVSHEFNHIKEIVALRIVLLSSIADLQMDEA